MSATASSSAAVGGSSNKKLRLAFIGAGGIAGAHLRALSTFEDVEVVALCDVNEKGMQDKLDAFDLKNCKTFTDYEAMLEAVEPDAVSICTPNGLHAPASIVASRAGAHVIVEKPMAMNAGEAKEMLAAARAAHRKLVIGFQYRYDPRSRFVKRMYDDGVLGDIRFARVQALRRRGIPNWGVFGRKDLQGGGPMIDIGVHVLEMCHYCMGSPRPVAAVGMTDTYLGDKPSNQIASNWAGWDHKTYTVEDLAIGHIRLESGAVIHIEASFAAHHQHNGKMDFQLMGTKGGVQWESSKLHTDQNGYMMDMTPAWVGPPWGFHEGFVVKNRNFIDHVLYDKPTTAPAEHGLMVQQMLDAVYQSADQGGKEVEIQ